MYSANQLGIDQLTLSADGRGFINVHGGSTNLSVFYPHIIPLEYTGLKDWDGTEIYEGDILESIVHGDFTNGFTKKKMTEYKHYPTVEVIWRDADACFSPFDDEDFALECCEVIGNVYETLELLEDK